MFFIKPYLEHLCNNSYDDDCNNYRTYLNKTIDINKNPDELTEAILEEIKEYATTFENLSLNNQFVEKIKKLLSEQKGNINKEDFKLISDQIRALLKANTNIREKNKKNDSLEKLKKIYESYKELIIKNYTKIATLKKQNKEQENDLVKLKEKLQKLTQDYNNKLTLKSEKTEADNINLKAELIVLDREKEKLSQQSRFVERNSFI